MGLWVTGEEIYEYTYNNEHCVIMYGIIHLKLVQHCTLMILEIKLKKRRNKRQVVKLLVCSLSCCTPKLTQCYNVNNISIKLEVKI